jgi:predicted permease
MSSFLQDLRYSWRILLKSPGFTAVAILVLTLGIGANTAIFSLVHSLLFRAPAYAQPTEVVQVFSQDRKAKRYRGFSYPTYQDIRSRNAVFSDTFAYNLAMLGIGEKGDTRRAFAATVSSNYFSVLGVAPARGRAFLPEEETPGANTAVAIVSHNYWRKQHFKPDLVGSSITLNGRPYTIVGVMPEHFTGLMQVFSVEVWVPLGVYDQLANDYDGINREPLTSRLGTQLLVVGRLKPGMTTTSAAPALATLASQLEQAYPVEQKDQTFTISPVSRFSTSTSPSDDNDIATLGALLLGMAAVVLLVACLNLANLLLARGTARRKEIAVRLALGGSRSRIIRQLLVEGLVLSVAGGAAGLLLAIWSSDLLVASLGRLMPLDIVWFTGPGPAVLAATFGFCVLGTVGFALGPAMKLSRGDVVTDLKSHAGEDAVVRRWRYLPRHPLVVAQIALSLALLTAAALFIRGARQAAAIDTGLHTDHSLLVELDASLGGFTPERSREIYRTLAERLAALPGVESSSISATVPFGMVSLGRPIQRAGLSAAPEATPATAAEGLAFPSHWNSVGADYFRSFGITLRQGRTFTAAESERTNGPAVAIIDETLARKLWPDGNALGQQIQIASEAAPRAKAEGGGAGIFEDAPSDLKPGDAIEVVGIVPTTRHEIFEKSSRGAIYVPFARGYQNNVYFHLAFKTPAQGAELTRRAELVRQTIRSVDPMLPILSLKTFEQHLDGNLELWLVRAGAALFSVFGGLALGLAVIGVYGVKAYAVARRTREIGIRLALGAQPESVLRMILREGALMLGAGVFIGLILAVVTGRLVSSLLYQVGALDPIAFTVAPVVLGLAAFLACWFPARRATRVSPLTALRTE